MSFFYKKSNSEGTRDLYLKKLIYDLNISEPEYDNLIDFYTAEKYLYGRVNFNYLAIQIDSPLSAIDNNVRAIKFVSEAFRGLLLQFDKKMLSGEIDANDPILGKLKAKKAYQDPETLYASYFNTVAEVMKSDARERKVKITNFNEFMRFYEDFVSKMAKSLPLTYPGFLKSRQCPMNVSGLVIEIADQSYANDEKKIQDFKNSKNWKFYLNACRSYGFFVDASNPWRLIANIGSEEMLYYARNTSMCRFTSTFDILTTAFRPAYITYLEEFKSSLYHLYMTSRRTVTSATTCRQGTTISKVTKPDDFTFEAFTKLYDDMYFFEKYIEIRLIEESISAEEASTKRIVKEAMGIAKAKGVLDAAAALEKVIGHTYNESGSLTDLIYRVKISKQEE